MGIQINGNTDNISATDGGLTISDLEINQSGISTFNGNIDANGDLDVDGHTNLDNVSIAGVTTFAGAVTTGDHITLTGQNPRITFTDSNHNPDFEIYGSAGIFQVWDSTNSTHRLVVNSSGQILLGAGAVATTKVTQSGSLDLDSGGISLCIGGNENSSGRTNSTNKLNRVVTPHYTNAEEPMAMISGYSTSGASELFYGGGSGLTNAATRHSFYTAANTTTTSGTERIRVVSNGKIIVGEANTNPVNDFEVRRANNGGDVAIRIGNNTGTNSGSTASLYFTTSPTQNFNTAYIQAVRDGGKLNFGYATNAPTVTMKVSNGDVGIGTDSPQSGGLTVLRNLESRLQVWANGDGSNGKIALRADGTNTQIGTWSNHDCKLVRNEVIQASIVSNGISFPAGKGIDFSATSDATGMTSELFDDYERGVHVISVTGSGGNPSVNLSANHKRLYYTKIGGMVHVTGELRWTTSSHGSGDLRISLPFQSDSSASSNSQGTAQTWNVNWAWRSETRDIWSEVHPGQSFLVFRLGGSGSLHEDYLQLGSTYQHTANSGYGVEYQVSLWYRTG